MTDEERAEAVVSGLGRAVCHHDPTCVQSAWECVFDGRLGTVVSWGVDEAAARERLARAMAACGYGADEIDIATDGSDLRAAIKRVRAARLTDRVGDNK